MNLRGILSGIGQESLIEVAHKDSGYANPNDTLEQHWKNASPHSKTKEAKNSYVEGDQRAVDCISSASSECIRSGILIPFEASSKHRVSTCC